jgi:hypothetical protein
MSSARTRTTIGKAEAGARPAQEGRRGKVSSKPRRLAVLAVAGTLAAASATAQAAPARAAPPSAAAQTPAHWVVVPGTAAARPPASVIALARDLGVDTDFAWKLLDELSERGQGA